MTRMGVVLVMMVAACGDDGGGGMTRDDAQVVVDTAVSIDAPLFTGPLIRKWVRAPEVPPDFAFDSITFNGDGTVVIDDDGELDMGTFMLPAPGRLTLVNGADSTESSYVLTSTHFLMGALLPDGVVTGILGTWSTTQTSTESGTITNSITFRDDMTATYSITAATTMSLEATWVAESSVIALTLPGPAVLHYVTLPGNEGIANLAFVPAP